MRCISFTLTLALSVFCFAGCKSETDRSNVAQALQKPQEKALDPFVEGFVKDLPASGAITFDESGSSTQALSLIGREDLIERDLPNCETVTLGTSAKSQILERARNSQVLIINEAHDRPEHRAFLEALLPDLYEAGFQTLAAETFNNWDAAAFTDFASSTDPFVPANAGAYTSEPIFARTVQTAKRLGFSLLAYEANNLSGTGDAQQAMFERERKQYENLKPHVTKPPKGKLLIFNGYGHAIEKPMLGDFEFLASLIKTRSGIDPLTIDQTICSVAGTEPHIVAPPDPSLIGAHDLFIAHPRIEIQHSRPSWRFERGDAFKIIPKNWIGAAGLTVFESRLLHAPADSVPFDRVGAWPRDHDVALFVPDQPHQITMSIVSSGP